MEKQTDYKIQVLQLLLKVQGLMSLVQGVKRHKPSIKKVILYDF